MDGLYKTTLHTVIAHHKSACIECQGSTTTSNKATTSDEGYICDDCGLRVEESSGYTAVDGDVSDSTKSEYNLELVA